MLLLDSAQFCFHLIWHLFKFTSHFSSKVLKAAGQFNVVVNRLCAYLTERNSSVMANHQLVREWVCLQLQEMPIGLQVTADWQHMCWTRTVLLRDLEMKKGLGRKMDESGFTYLYTHTVQQLKQYNNTNLNREGFLREEFSDAKTFFFLFIFSTLFLFLPCSCVELQCDLNKIPSSAS